MPPPRRVKRQSHKLVRQSNPEDTAHCPARLSWGAQNDPGVVTFDPLEKSSCEEKAQHHGRGSVLVLTSALVCALKHSVSGPVIRKPPRLLWTRGLEDERGELGDHCGRGHRNSIPKSITSPDLGSARRWCFYSMNIRGLTNRVSLRTNK
jgi:hypothetical protein